MGQTLLLLLARLRIRGEQVGRTGAGVSILLLLLCGPSTGAAVARGVRRSLRAMQVLAR